MTKQKVANALVVLAGLAVLALVLVEIMESTRSRVWTLELMEPLAADEVDITTNVLRRRALGLHPSFSPIVRRTAEGDFTVRLRGALPVPSAANDVLTRGGQFRALPVVAAGAMAADATPLLVNAHIIDVRVTLSPQGTPRVDMQLIPAARERVAAFFQRNPFGRIALEVDGEVGAHATAGELSGPLLVFNPGWSAADGETAFALAAILEGGPLPVALRVKQTPEGD